MISACKKALERLSESLPQFRSELLSISLVIHLVSLALPLALLQIYDRILPSQSYGTAIFLVIGVAIAIILEGVLRYGRSELFAAAGARYEAQTTVDFLGRLQEADIAKIEKIGTARVSDALRAIGQVRGFWSGQAGAALYELPFVPLYIFLITYIGGWLGLIPLTLFILAIVIMLFITPALQESVANTGQLAKKRLDLTWATMNALSYIKAIGSEQYFASIWRRVSNQYMGANATLEIRMGWIRENATAIGQIATVLIVAFGAVQVIAGNLTTGSLAACTLLAGRSIGPAMASLSYWSQLASIREAQSRIDDILGLPENPAFVPEKRKQELTVTEGSVEIKSEFLATKEAVIKPGELVYLDTEDTSLASAFLSAIAGISTNPGLQVSVDGHDISAYFPANYRKGVALVTRNLALVPGSILNNLTLYDPTYNGDVGDYCEKLGLQRYLDQLRYGILTEVGSSSAEQLDHGIFQRIAIIRALVRKPKILLLDHAASGVDIDGTKRLAALLESMQGETTVFIATYKEELKDLCGQTLTLAATEQPA